MIGFLLFYLVTAGLFTLGIAYGYRTLRTHENFAVDNLILVGASKKTESDLRKKLSWVHGLNFFSVDLSRVRMETTSHPWVEGAVVRGLLPRTLRVQVVERQPAGLARVKDNVLVIAEDHKPLAHYNQYGTALDTPVITGLENHKNPEESIARGLATLKIIRETSLLFWDQIETLDLSDAENMIVHLRSVNAPVHLGKEVIPANLKNYLAIAHRIESDYPQLHYIELGFPDQIAILPKEVKD
ncbi:MAG: FtsQ-type POTRA domain-containing protein [Acidobacteriota bacterium]|nr:FtsQ-type POTRA domain-containing protein [Acidobacteriota bacterium]